MSDHDEQPSRRRVLQAGLFALAATQMPDGLVARAQAQGVKPSTSLIGKLGAPRSSPTSRGIRRRSRRRRSSPSW